MKDRLEKSVETLGGELCVLQNESHRASEETFKIRSTKRQAKEIIERQFEEINNAFDIKKRSLLKEIDETDLGEEDINRLISDTQGTINVLSSAITTGNTLLSGWNSTTITPNIANDTVSVVNKLGKTENLKRTFSEICGYETFVEPSTSEKEAKKLMLTANNAKRVLFRKVSTHGLKDLKCKEIGPFFVSLEWEECRQDDKYIITMHKDGSGWDFDSSPESNENNITITTLEPNRVYVFSIKVKRDTVLSDWSKTLTVKTAPLTVENITTVLVSNGVYGNAICVRSLREMKILAEKGKKIFIYLFLTF